MKQKTYSATQKRYSRTWWEHVLYPINTAHPINRDLLLLDSVAPQQRDYRRSKEHILYSFNATHSINQDLLVLDSAAPQQRNKKGSREHILYSFNTTHFINRHLLLLDSAAPQPRDYRRSREHILYSFNTTHFINRHLLVLDFAAPQKRCNWGRRRLKISIFNPQNLVVCVCKFFLEVFTNVISWKKAIQEKDAFEFPCSTRWILSCVSRVFLCIAFPKKM